jgi:dethiobiotin synthetase
VRGLFVTGTGTGVGKTVLSAALLAAMRAEGESVRAHKPVVTGLSEPAGSWPADHELLARAAGMDPFDVAPLRYEPVSSPRFAAELTGEKIDARELVERARAAGASPPGSTDGGVGDSSEGPVLIVEGVGGLLVPLTDRFTVCDLAVELTLPLVIAAAAGLGTINHTLLTLQAARAAQLDVRAVVLTPWPDEPSPVELSNRETISHMGEVEVDVLAHVASPEVDTLAEAAQRLPWRRWLRND